MADFSDRIDAPDFPFTGEDIAEKHGLIFFADYFPFSGSVIGNPHVSANPAITYYICGCCGRPICRTVPCIQCSDGYAPYFLHFGYYLVSGNLDVSNKVVLVVTNDVGFTWPIHIFSTVDLSPSGDCEWQGQTWEVVFPSTGGPPFYFLAYWTLYYDSGWKISVDISNFVLNLGFDPTAPLNVVTVISLADPLNCPSAMQWLAATITGQPRTGWTSQMVDSGGNPITDFFVYFQSCGTPLLTVDCCTERVPKWLNAGPYDCDNGGDPIPGGIDLTFLWQTGSTWTSTYITDFPTPIPVYFFVLECQTDHWHLTIYVGTDTSGLVVYDSDADSSVCYPIYLRFTGIPDIDPTCLFPSTIEITA